MGKKSGTRRQLQQRKAIAEGFASGRGVVTDELDGLVEWVRHMDRPETAGHLLVSNLAAGSPALAPNVPLLGLGLELRPSGLWAPAPKARYPIDMMASYTTLSDLVGEKWNQEVFATHLHDQPLFVTLAGLAHLCCLLELRGGMSEDFLDEFIREACPPPLVDLLRAHVRQPGVGISSPQVALAAMNFTLLNGGETEGDTHWQRIGLVLLATGDHLDTREVREDMTQLELEIVRYGLFFHHTYATRLWGRSYRMWEEVAPSLSDDPEHVDVIGTIEQATGVPWSEYCALGFAFYALLQIRKKTIMNSTLWIDTSDMKIEIEAEIVTRFQDSWAAEAEWYRERIDERYVAWDFTMFQERPLYRHKERLVALSAQYVLEKATTGVYYTVLEHLRPQGKHTSWQNFFGDVWETYVHQLLAETVPGDRLVPESRLKEAWPPGRKSCDNLILYPDRWLMVESAAKRMNVQTSARGGPDSLENDLRAAVLKKARQLADAIDVLQADPSRSGITSHDYPKRFMPVIALPGPFPVLPTVVQKVRELIEADDECKALGGDDVDDLVIVSADDLELLLGTATASGRTLVELLDEWQASTLREISFQIWLMESRPTEAKIPAWVEEGARAMTDRSSRVLFGNENT